MGDDEVTDDAEHHRFRYREDGVEAELVYRVRGDQLILVHTEVPDAIGGHGIGGKLVGAAIARATRTGESILPQCPYARKWLDDHPDAAAAVTIDRN